MAGISFSHNAGDVIDCNEAEALDLVKRGYAEPVAEQRIEKAMKKPRGRKAVADEG